MSSQSFMSCWRTNTTLMAREMTAIFGDPGVTNGDIETCVVDQAIIVFTP